MRIPLLMLFASLGGSLAAQCTFTPTITPPAPILCPGDAVVLTTQVYDGYQWFKDGQPILGATAQTQVATYADAGSAFTVQATLDSCTEMSAPVLVDGWAFLLPYVIHAGAPSTPDSLGNPTNCVGDTVLLIMGAPNTVNVQWTLNGSPIQGATDDTLVVTTSGSYSASGAPVMCPNFIQQLGVSIDITFISPTQPLITQIGTDLCASPTGQAYQWYLDGVALPSGTTPCIPILGVGLYTVSVDYGGPCENLSAPFVISSIAEPQSEQALQLFPNPTRGAVRISRGDEPLVGNWGLVDLQGREVMAGRFRGFGDEWIDVSALPAGRYWLRPQLGADWAPAAITVLD
ncbi:MAG: hypothetical protein JNL05_02190 [Flavobacteriales bacterium]|nr:hypothetical protein [Flavobacteriales bacterium]